MTDHMRTPPNTTPHDTITTPDQLDALPPASVVLDGVGRASQRYADGLWWRTADVNPTLGGRTTERVLRYGPVTVLFRPDAPARGSADAETLRAEVERLTRERDSARGMMTGAHEREDARKAERDAARTEAATLRTAIADARFERNAALNWVDSVRAGIERHIRHMLAVPADIRPEREALAADLRAILADGPAPEGDVNVDGLATAVSRARAALVNDAFRTDRLPAPTLPIPVEVLRVLADAGAAVVNARALPAPEVAPPTLTVERLAEAMYEAQRAKGDTLAWDGMHADGARTYWYLRAEAVLAALGVTVVDAEVVRG
jgi:hypothetical protein